MTVRVALPTTDEVWLRAEAQRQGVGPAEIIQRIVHQQAVPVQQAVLHAPQERISAMDAIAAANRNAPVLADAAFDRESLYDERL